MQSIDHTTCGYFSHLTVRWLVKENAEAPVWTVWLTGYQPSDQWLCTDSQSDTSHWSTRFQIANIIQTGCQRAKISGFWAHRVPKFDFSPREGIWGCFIEVPTFCNLSTVTLTEFPAKQADPGKLTVHGQFVMRPFFPPLWQSIVGEERLRSIPRHGSCSFHYSVYYKKM